MKDKLFIFLSLLLVSSVVYRFSFNSRVSATNDCYVQKEKVAVEIKGLVKNPGVYYLEEGKRIIDLINVSGGLMPEASLDCINQTTLLKDKMTVYIASDQEVAEIYTIPENSTVIEPPEQEEEVIEVCTCEYVTVKKSSEEAPSNNSEIEDIISLNEASIAQLSSLPGIGETKAKAIIDYRNKTPFKDASEIVNVKGIGQATYEKIKDLIKE